MKTNLIIAITAIAGIVNLNAQRVGINTTSPTASFHITTPNSDDPLRIENLKNSDLASVSGLDKTYDTSIIIVKNSNSKDSNEIGVVKSVKAVMPVFFYCPPINLPIYTPQGNRVTGTQTINLYEVYENQFENKAATTTSISSVTTGTINKLPVISADGLIYHITYFDNTVFNNVNITPAGVLTYEVNSSAVLTDKTYMTIIFEVKNT